MPRLEDWFIVLVDPFVTRELQGRRLKGKIYDDKRFPDGVSVTTSEIVKFNPKSKKAQTKNTLYVLGDPDEFFMQYAKINNIDQDILKGGF